MDSVSEETHNVTPYLAPFLPTSVKVNEWEIADALIEIQQVPIS
jgi:hypothetical protein